MAKFTAMASFTGVRRLVIDAEDPKEAAQKAKEILNDSPAIMLDLAVAIHDGDIFGDLEAGFRENLKVTDIYTEFDHPEKKEKPRDYL